MKIVKADAKGRVTGLEAATQYRMEHLGDGSVVLTPRRHDMEKAPLVGVANVYEWLGVLGLDANQVLAEDIQIGQLTTGQIEDSVSKGAKTLPGTGVFIRVWDLDEEGNPVMSKNGMELESRLVCIALDNTKPE